MTTEEEVSACIEKLRLKLVRQGGVEIEIVEDPEIPYPAKTEIAGIYGRDHHIIRVNPRANHTLHLTLSMLVRRGLELDASELDNDLTPMMNGGERLDFVNFLKKDPGFNHLVMLRGKKQAREFLEKFIDSIALEDFSQVYEITINDRIAKKYTCDLPLLQKWIESYYSVMARVKEKEDAQSCFDFTRHLGRMAFMLYGMHAYKVCGVNGMRYFNPSPEEMDELLDLYSFYLKYARKRRGRKAGDEKELAMKVLEKLGMGPFMHLEKDTSPCCFSLEEIAADAKKYKRPPVDTDSVAVIDAPVMARSMVSAMEKLSVLSKERVSKIALELSSFPVGVETLEYPVFLLNSYPEAGRITGREALALRYVALASSMPGSIPVLDFPYKKAYKAALSKFNAERK